MGREGMEPKDREGPTGGGRVSRCTSLSPTRGSALLDPQAARHLRPDVARPVSGGAKAAGGGG